METVTAAMLLMTVGVSAHSTPAALPDVSEAAAPIGETAPVDTGTTPLSFPATVPSPALELPTLETSEDTLFVSADIGADGTYIGTNHADDDALREKWSRIPANTDVLITHTPPAGILDRSRRGQGLGCTSVEGV